MEILLKKALLVLWVLLSFQDGVSQDFVRLQDAFSRSYFYESSGNYERAAQELRQVYDERSYEINLRLGWLYYLQAKFMESQNHYEISMRLRPMAIEARLGAVLPAASLGNMDVVISHYQAIIKIDPGNTTAHYRLGLIYYNRKDYKNAYRHFEKVANLYPFDYDAIHMFAWTNYHLKKNREAKVLFQKALLIRPTDASSLEGLELLR